MHKASDKKSADKKKLKDVIHKMKDNMDSKDKSSCSRVKKAMGGVGKIRKGQY
jgi:predicted nucleic acid-binding Zn ribbon protein